MEEHNAEEQSRQLTPELLRMSANLASQMAMISLSTITCELHEHCDGSCSGDGPVVLEPLQVGHNPYRAKVQDRPVFNLPLVQKIPTQIPSEGYQYSPISSSSGEIRVLRPSTSATPIDPVSLLFRTIGEIQSPTRL